MIAARAHLHQNIYREESKLRSAPRHRCSVRGDERCVRAVGEAAPRSLSRSRTLAPPLPVPLAPSLLSRAVSMAARPLRRARSPRAPISTFLYFSFLTGLSQDQDRDVGGMWEGCRRDVAETVDQLYRYNY
ncbi:unnamed protein product [Arctia plantaginis]|uniref:Uncharacterized protein n=1 Tax=Arctia plantaginis TaxID=874455 RepID=A0A8S0ZU17_ARCPL|nr:unnamed protein product [Arctia plantaginis]